MKNIKWYIAYAIVAGLGLALPFSISVKLMTPTQAQTPPAQSPPVQSFEEKLNTAPSQLQLQEVVSESEDSPQQMGSDPALVEIDPNLVGVDNDETYLYDPTNKRDPFLPYKATVIEFIPEVIQRQTENLEALQMYEIDELKVVGILWGTSNPKALIKDPLGNVHTLVRLQKVGKNNGYVEAIREGAVLAVEDALENGKVTKVVKVLSIRK